MYLYFNSFDNVQRNRNKLDQPPLTPTIKIRNRNRLDQPPLTPTIKIDKKRKSKDNIFRPNQNFLNHTVDYDERFKMKEK